MENRLAVLFLLALSFNRVRLQDLCGVAEEAREDCGYKGIPPEECTDSRGCCWDDSVRERAPHCFFALECSDDLSIRHPCGHLPFATPPDVCDNMGCCFYEDNFECFLTFNNDRKCLIPNEEREVCDIDGTSREECVADPDCCFDDSVGDAAPHCYKAGNTDCKCTECGAESNPGEQTCDDELDTEGVGVTPIARDNEFPFVAQVDQSQGRSVKCAGTIIDCFHVLTAEACVGSHGTADVRVGSNVWGEGTYRRAKVTVHPTIKSVITGELYDIAVLTLERALKWSDKVQPICLPDESYDFDDQPAQLIEAGWKFKLGNATSIKGDCLRSQEVDDLHNKFWRPNLLQSGNASEEVSVHESYEGNPLFGKGDDGKYTLFGLSTDTYTERLQVETYVDVGFLINDWYFLYNVAKNITEANEKCEESGESGESEEGGETGESEESGSGD